MSSEDELSSEQKEVDKMLYAEEIQTQYKAFRDSRGAKRFNSKKSVSHLIYNRDRIRNAKAWELSGI